MAITQYKTLAAALTGELDLLAADAIADGWQPLSGPYLGRGDMHVQAFVKGTPAYSTEVSSADITDATAVGVAVLTAEDEAAARAAIGAPSQAAPVADAIDGTDVVAQLNALLAALRASGALDTA